MTTENISKSWDARQKNKLKNSGESKELEELLVETIQRNITTLKK